MLDVEMVEPATKTLERLKEESQAPDKGLGPLPEGRNEVPQIPTKPVFQLKTVSADELLTREWPEPAWVVPAFIPVGLTLLAGKSKVGKSWLALQLAQAVATGGRFLGTPAPQGAVLYFALEDAPRRLSSRMKAQGWPPGRGHCDFVHSQDARPLWPLNRTNAERLARVVESEGYRLVIIDTFSRLYGGDQNDVSQVTAALGPLQEVANRLGVAVLLIDHHNKLIQSEDGFDPILAILGSTAKGAIADCIWGLYRERGKAGATLAGTGRDLEDVCHALRWDGLTKSWQLEETGGLSESAREVLEAVADLGEATCSQIASAIGRDVSNTHKVLADLLNMGRLIRKGRLYALASEDAELLPNIPKIPNIPNAPKIPIGSFGNLGSNCEIPTQMPSTAPLDGNVSPAPIGVGRQGLKDPLAGPQRGEIALPPLGARAQARPPLSGQGPAPQEPEDPYEDVWAGIL